MPAVVSSTDWSSAEGTSEAEGTARCPRSTKNSVKLRRISSDVVTEPTPARFYGAVLAGVAAESCPKRLSCTRSLLPMAEM